MLRAGDLSLHASVANFEEEELLELICEEEELLERSESSDF